MTGTPCRRAAAMVPARGRLALLLTWAGPNLFSKMSILFRMPRIWARLGLPPLGTAAPLPRLSRNRAAQVGTSSTVREPVHSKQTAILSEIKALHARLLAPAGTKFSSRWAPSSMVAGQRSGPCTCPTASPLKRCAAPATALTLRSKNLVNYMWFCPSIYVKTRRVGRRTRAAYRRSHEIAPGITAGMRLNGTRALAAAGRGQSPQTTVDGKIRGEIVLSALEWKDLEATCIACAWGRHGQAQKRQGQTSGACARMGQ